MNNEKTGALIAELRKEKGLTQDQLGEQVFVSGKAVSKWERGLSFPSVDVLEKLAEVLGITVTELLAGERIEQEQLPEKAGEVTLQVLREERVSRKRILAVCALILAAVLVPILWENWSALGERGNPLPYLGKLGVIATQGFAELPPQGDESVSFITLRHAKKKVFSYIETRWEVTFREQMGRGWKFDGETCSLNVLKDGYLGIFTIWQVYAYPKAGT